MDIELPLTTRILMFIAETTKVYGIFIVIGFIGLIVIFKFLISLSSVKPLWHKFILSLPFFGKFLQHVQLSTFFRNLGIMLNSGLPITSALETQKNSTTNFVYRNYLNEICKDVNQGKSIYQSVVSRKMQYFPMLATKMIDVGEKSGKLNESLLYLGDYFEDEVSVASKDFATVLEPVILIIVGLIVAYLALAIISPIYQFTGSIKK